MVELNELANKLTSEGKNEERGFLFEVNPIPGDVEVLQIVVEDREELPIFLSASEDQILCIAYLFKLDEVKSDELNEMNRTMLTANISVPLSAFGILDDHYVIYGALATQSGLDDIIHELEVLSSNALDAIEAMRDYLK
jgi:uncharacterized protein YjfI (DUF2170 family)